MTRAYCLLAALALAACGQPAPAPNEVADNDSVVPVANDPAPTAPEPAPIPARFRGIWAEDKAACADLEHHSRITISGRTVRHPTFVIVGDTVESSADRFSLKGHFEGSGRPAEAQYFINEAGDVLTDGGGGGPVRVRCA